MSTSSACTPRQKRGAKQTPFGWVAAGSDQAFTDLSVADSVAVGSIVGVPTVSCQDVVSLQALNVVSCETLSLVGGADTTLVTAQDFTVSAGQGILLDSESLVANARGLISLASEALSVNANLIQIEANAAAVFSAQGPIAFASEDFFEVTAPNIFLNGNVTLPNVVVQNIDVCGLSCPNGTFTVNSAMSVFSGNAQVVGTLTVCDLHCEGTLVLDAEDLQIPNDMTVGNVLFACNLQCAGPQLSVFAPTVAFSGAVDVGGALSTCLVNCPGTLLLNTPSASFSGGAVVSTNVVVPNVVAPGANLSLIAANSVVVSNNLRVNGTTLTVPIVAGPTNNLALNSPTVTVSNLLDVAGNVDAAGAVNVPLVTNPAGPLFLAAPSGQNVNVLSNLFATQSFSVADDATVGRNLYACNLVCIASQPLNVLSSQVSANGNLSLGGNLSVTQNSSLGGNLNVGGYANVAGDVVVGGALNVTGTLNICAIQCDGATVTLTNSNVLVGGNLIGNANVSAAGSLVAGAGTVTPNVSFGNTLLNLAANNFAVSATLVRMANVNVSSNLNVVGNVNTPNLISTNTTLRIISVNTDLPGNLNLGNHVRLTNAASMLTVLGAANFNNDVRVGGDLTVVGSLNFAAGDLQVCNLGCNTASTDLRLYSNFGNVRIEPANGHVRANGNLNVAGFADVTGFANVGGNLNVGANLFARNVVCNFANMQLFAGQVNTNAALRVGTTASVGSSLTTGSFVQVGGNLSVAGTTNLVGAVTANSVSTAAGDFALTATGPSNVVVSGTELRVFANTNFFGDSNVVGNLNVAGDLTVAGNFSFGTFCSNTLSPCAPNTTLTANAADFVVTDNISLNFATNTDPSTDTLVLYNSTSKRFVNAGPYCAQFLTATEAGTIVVLDVVGNPAIPASYTSAVFPTVWTPLAYSTYSPVNPGTATYTAATGVYALASPAGSFYAGWVDAMLDDALAAGTVLQLGVFTSVDGGANWVPYAIQNTQGTTSAGYGVSAHQNFSLATTANPFQVRFGARIINSAGPPINLTGAFYGLRSSLKLLA